jgi:hypothetical protein
LLARKRGSPQHLGHENAEHASTRDQTPRNNELYQPTIVHQNTPPAAEALWKRLWDQSMTDDTNAPLVYSESIEPSSFDMVSLMDLGFDITQLLDMGVDIPTTI